MKNEDPTTCRGRKPTADKSELLARVSHYRLMHALISKPADRAAIEDHIAELERKLNDRADAVAAEENGRGPQCTAIGTFRPALRSIATAVADFIE